ncbi:MAG TPA: porin family protein, partial [Alphaproteobacteria bacterium]
RGEVMRTKLLATAALAAVLGYASQAQAEGIYVGAFGGLTIPEHSDGTFDVLGVSEDVEIESHPGWAAGAAVGYGFDFGLRAEGEIAYRSNELNRFNVVGNGLNFSGDATALSAMGNVWYEFPLSDTLRPFLGGGAGMAQISLEDAELLGVQVVDDSDWVFAYQLGAGLGYRLSPGLDLTAEYRYFGAEEANFELETAAGGAEAEYTSHSVLFGVRYSFQ